MKCKRSVHRSLFSIALALALTLAAGCAGNSGASPQTPGSSQAQYISIGTSGSGGTYASVGTAMVKVINDNSSIVSSIEATPGGGDGNIRLLGSGEIEFGLAPAAAGYSAYHRQAPFDDTDCTSIRTVMAGLDSTFHIIVPADSDIRGLTDMAGKRIGTGSAGNANVYVPQLLEACGMSRDQVEIVQLEMQECADALKDGNISAIVTLGTPPASAFQDLAVSRDVKFLSIPDEVVSGLIKLYPFYSPCVIEAGTYPTQTEDVSSATIKVMLYTQADVPEELVYTVTKTLLEHNGELAAIHPAAQKYSQEIQSSYFSAGEIIPPVHPGAEKYYRETGVIQ